eukprot:1158844-Pelagomonas_calceolata.AAC.4
MTRDGNKWPLDCKDTRLRTWEVSMGNHSSKSLDVGTAQYMRHTPALSTRNKFEHQGLGHWVGWTEVFTFVVCRRAKGIRHRRGCWTVCCKLVGVQACKGHKASDGMLDSVCCKLVGLVGQWRLPCSVQGCTGQKASNGMLRHCLACITLPAL